MAKHKVIEPKSDHPDPHHHEKGMHIVIKILLIIIILAVVAYVIITTGFWERILRVMGR
ncbi:MAG: hypothetical protein KJ601_05815 [Nanoarchaeota archaeon]|nr:hypothetical protein [Nanoarchaeota archaeon]MBU1704098.1 hypothetical protein [Nanoarchaeota archaeon]